MAARARARTSTPCLFCPLLLSFPPSEPGADWLEDRLESVYKQHPGYSDKASTLFTIDLGAPEELPDALRGEKWSFVQLPLGTLQQVRRAGQCAGAAISDRLQTARIAGRPSLCCLHQHGGLGHHGSAGPSRLCRQARTPAPALHFKKQGEAKAGPACKAHCSA